MRKKLFLVLICCFLLLGLTGCGGNTEEKESKKEYKSLSDALDDKIITIESVLKSFPMVTKEKK